MATDSFRVRLEIPRAVGRGSCRAAEEPATPRFQTARQEPRPTGPRISRQHLSLRLASVALAVLACCAIPGRAHAAQPGSGLENQALRLVATPGQAGIVVSSKAEEGGKRIELTLLTSGASKSSLIDQAEVSTNKEGEKFLRVVAGGAQAELTLGAGPFVKVTPVKNAAALEVKADARYAALPDFFADDVVFDPVHLPMRSMSVPAENFLLQFVEGGDTIVMCIWPGKGKRPEAKTADAPAPKEAKEGPAPQVDLLFAGEGKARRVSAVRLAFQDQPVYAGLLEQKGIWQDVDAASLPAYKPTPIAWKRPFEARWRGDFIVREGQRLADWPMRNQSFDFRSTSNLQKENADPLDARFLAATSSKRSANWWETGLQWWERGNQDSPEIWQESLASFFIYPAVFKSNETRLCLYTDKQARSKPHVYEHVLIYPLGRVAGTPLDVFTPVDLMRETLGQGPCEYILDLAGIKPRPAGGDRPTLAYATCGLWDYHLKPILGQLKKKPDGTFEPLDEKTKTHLVQAMEDMWYFVHAIHDRLREYKQWGAEAEAFCKKESATNPPSKPIADPALAQLARLNADLARHKFDGPGSEAYWKVRIPELIQMVKADNYADVAAIGKIRDLGNDQDERVSRCRQYVKAVLQEILFQDTSQPSARAFAADLRDRCHRMLRNQCPKEGF
jgi:hypothetical protein